MAVQLVPKHLKDHCCHGADQLAGFSDNHGRDGS